MKRRKLSPADFRALNAATGGPVVSRYPPDGGRVKVNVPAEPKPRRRKGSR